MRRYLMTILVFALFAFIAACSVLDVPSEEPENLLMPTLMPEPTPASEDVPDETEVATYKIGICIRGNWKPYHDKIEEYFTTSETDTVRYDVNTVYSRDEVERHIQQVESLIEEDVNVLIIEPVQPVTTTITRITQIANDASIPVVYISCTLDDAESNEINNVCYIVADYRQACILQGEIIANLPDNGDINGDGVVSYVMISGDPENVDAQTWLEYSIVALTDAGIKTEELTRENGDWAQRRGWEITSAALKKFGEKVDVIICNNDGMALGASDAIKTAGRIVGEDIYLVGIDAIPECLDLINQYEMTGSVSFNVGGYARAAVDAAINYIEGRDNETYILIDYVPVTQGWSPPWYLWW